ncbi:hypothetical protein MUK42_34205 [Musa troglodytarum]|uniref:Uncharacterized protein n=1 Tax=Musa troglodytarum TaxID=320322 RepID=A0A9E7FUW3_9LILI|nr:hypothetical protein MUK42_34205 [Musa troglodytarum]
MRESLQHEPKRHETTPTSTATRSSHDPPSSSLTVPPPPPLFLIPSPTKAEVAEAGLGFDSARRTKSPDVVYLVYLSLVLFPPYVMGFCAQITTTAVDGGEKTFNKEGTLAEAASSKGEELAVD